ncbi:MAG: hypothetical protein WCS31_09065 [Verrucomicrobiae bacterium]
MNKTKLVPGLALSFAVMLWVSLTGQAAQAADNPQWFRGQLHAHTYWSDGRGFPEQAVEAYKQRGYQFLCITDHNLFAENKEIWREVAEKEGSWPPTVTQAIFDNYVQTFGKEWVESKTENKTNGPVTSVRLKTHTEVKAKFEEPGKFILLPGVELTQTVHGLGLHLNYVNLPWILPCIKGAGMIKTVEEGKTMSEMIALNSSEVEKVTIKRQRPFMLTLNHPFWVYYDVAPQILIDRPEIRFFEVCNGGSDHAPHPQAPNYTCEKYWDIVNAFRRIQGHPLLYGIGTDDAHFYDAQRTKGICGVGDAWVMVRAADLTPKHLLAAMHKGDFYASSGVFLEEAAFIPADNTLRVKVKVEPGVHYRIDFITTKQGFDRTRTEMACPAENGRPARTIPIYSDDIGRIVKTVEGTEAAYRLEADDLYVRARVESDSPSKFESHFHPKVKMAWTQPYAAKGTSSEKTSGDEPR